MDGTPQERTTKAFENGAYAERENETDKTDSEAELEENERKLTQLERNLNEPTGLKTEQPLADDQGDEKGFREVGSPPHTRDSPAEERAVQEIYETIGYDADMEGLHDYPVPLTGDIQDVGIRGGQVFVSYQIEQGSLGKLRDHGFQQDDEIGTLLTPSENLTVDVEANEDYIEIDLFYDQEKLVPGSREVAEKLEEVEDYLSV